ncbi:MAG: 30S ribosomal protein S12 methylthiotransferase RimO [Clostridia bacterium]|nr:30S ribosomal protein S12 methylthiotransferase RimO [Clostridia bacterium]
MPKVGLISLGCPKNQVDAELMLAKLADAGFELSNQAEGCDIVIVNTCGFIEDAKKEAIDTIFEMVELKKAGQLSHIIISGCLAERYREEVAREIPEADAVIGIGANSDIVGVCNAVLAGGQESAFPAKDLMPLCGDRILTTPAHWAYLKIADGCSNCCSYCAIPLIRGAFRSRPMEEIITEAKALCEGGVREIVLIAQDTTRYGEDLCGKPMLAALLEKLCEIDFARIRIYYCYPDRITDELIAVMRDNEKIVNYIDLPLQHASGRVLKAMNRRGDRQSLTALLQKIRKEIPDCIFRTTFICGFPGESEADFTELCEFVNEIGFDRMGAFAYSPEEDTPAATMPAQIDERIKARRVEVLMNTQYNIILEKNKSYIGKVFDVMVDSYDFDSCLYFGRSYMDAPEIDTGVYFASENELQPGDIVPVEILDFDEYDLIGREADKEI